MKGRKNMNGMKQTVAAVSIFAAFAAGAANIADEIQAIRAEIASNGVERSTGRGKCRYYTAWFVENCTAEEREAILERNISAHRRWIELAPKDPAPRADLGCVFATVGRWKEAKPELEAAIAAGDKLDPARRAKVRWEMASCLWVEGDKEGAKKLVGEVSAMGKDFVGLKSRAVFLANAFAGEDAELDTFTLPHSVDCKPFPTPQEATYGVKKVSLAKVELKVRGMRDADPIIRLLKRKLSRFGATFASGGTPIEIELSPDAPVDKPQGYSLDVANGKVVVKARSRLGLTYGVVSLIQCIERRDERDGSDQSDRPRICEMEIRDWPKCGRRGVVVYWQPEHVEFALFCKMSTVTFKLVSGWSLSPMDMEFYRLLAERMNGFGIEMYSALQGLAMNPMLPLSSPRTWEFHLERARLLASVGAGLSFLLDDFRFPAHHADIKAAGTAANLDAKYVNRLYSEVKSEYPGFFMQFCPPFYWGPDGSAAAYPEPREPYLKSLGADLDPAIDVHWTGPRVKSHLMSDEKVKWYADLIGRKPTIWHNGNAIGQHSYLQFGADPTGYKKSHSPRLFDSIACFQQNMSHYSEAGEVGSCMDWCWNPDVHDGADSVRRAVNMLEGPGVADIIEKATPTLSYFDKYLYYKPRVELLNEDQARLDKVVADSEAAWKDVLAIAKNNGEFVRGFENATKWARQKTEIRRNPPEWLKKQYEAVKSNSEYAVKEVGFNEENGDQFMPALLLKGGEYYGEAIADAAGDTRTDVKFIETGMELSGSFVCKLFPPEDPVKLIVTGIRFLDVWEKPPKVAAPELEVEVNGRVVWRGVMHAEEMYKPFEIKLPTDVIRRDNTFTIRNPGPYVKDQGRPVVHYVVIRKDK